MARNTKIENPTRVAIATVENENQYQMARNRGIDQTNQYMETNVAADINIQGKSNLMRLAESLKEASPIIEDYVNRKEKEQEVQDVATASQDFLIKKPKSMEEANKQAEGKSLAYRKAYAAMSGNIFADESKNNILDKFIKSPDKENINIRDLVAEEVSKNKGIKDPYFLTSFNQSITPAIEKLTGIQSKINQENFLEESKLRLLTDLTVNKLPLNAIYENGRMLGLQNSDIKQITKKFIQDAADNGDINTVDKLTKQALEYADAKGFKPYAGEENEFGKMGLIALRNFGAKLETEDKVRDVMLTKADNKEWQETIPLLMEETDPGKIDSYKRNWKTKMIAAGMSPEEIVKRERLIDSMLIPKEATVDQSVFMQKLLLEFNSGKNPLGANPIETLETFRREGLLTGKQNSLVFGALLSYKDQQVKKAEQLSNQIKSENRQMATMERRREEENLRSMTSNLKSSLYDLKRKTLNSVDDTLTPQIMGLGTNNKSANDLLKVYGLSSIADIETKYILKINELNSEKNPQKQAEMYQQLNSEMSQEYTNQAIILNNFIPKFNKEYIDNNRAEMLDLELNIAKSKGMSEKDFIKSKNLTEKDITALEVYMQNRKSFSILKEEKIRRQKEKESNQVPSTTVKRTINN